jgi:peptidoglycan/xylan/chitin deacetylase (PgdA/CDA1 family)
MKDPVLTPRPVCSGPAAGALVRLTPGADWTTRDFPQPVVPQSQTRVAVLGYHNFSNTKPVSDMLLRTSEFCQQMQYIQDAGLTVITMQDFLDWLSGSRCLPERCVLITIDDGWRSVYTDAFPVLKAYGYPFTLFLYTSYLSGKGFSMTPEMIQEMLECGATVGSHSATHLYPSQWKRYDEASPEYAAQLQQELPDSVEQLKSLFGNCSTYCYPGGYNTEPMLRVLKEQGVSAAFTVLEKKVTSLENPLLVHRYMVFGTDPRIFRRAVSFDDVPGIKPTAQGITEARERARRFFPQAFEAVAPAPAPEQVAPTPQQPIPAPVEQPAPKAQLDEIPAPVYTNPQA